MDDDVTAQWMTTARVANESGRHPRSVNDALRRRLLCGVQACPRGTWRIERKSFDLWMRAGAPIDDVAKARLRRMA